jgi:hypothetical protein
MYCDIEWLESHAGHAARGVSGFNYLNIEGGVGQASSFSSGGEDRENNRTFSGIIIKKCLEKRCQLHIGFASIMDTTTYIILCILYTNCRVIRMLYDVSDE